MRKSSVLKVFFILLFAGYFCASNLFSHTHIVNGDKIVHSHPYSNGHTHNTSDYQLIQDLTHFPFMGNSIGVSFQMAVVEFQKIEFYYQKDYFCETIRDYSTRGPPYSL